MSMLRHIAACNTARLPGSRQALRVGSSRIGWVSPELAATLSRFDGVRHDGRAVVLREDAAGELPRIGRALADTGRFRWRGEVVDVRVSQQAAALAQIDRGALPLLGMLSVGVHLNGLVWRSGAWWLWVGRRAADKPLDPDKLDHLVAGGVPAGLSPWQTLVKEAAEEASLPEGLLSRAQQVSRLAYAMERPEGLRRDVLVCYDVVLPESFVPVPADGEMASFQLWPLSRVMATVQAADAFKFNVNLVLIDLFRRLGVA